MIVVIADDFSGAAELANAAVQAGLSAEVQLRFHPGSDADVICVDTETRSLPAEDAIARVKEVAQPIEAVSPTLIYKKCDSVLRGSVAEESRVIARMFGKKRVLLIPANPGRQRIIRDGNYFVEGIPLDRTAFADDPAYLRRTSNVVELLGNASGIEIPDVTSTADLTRHALNMDSDTLPVGAVDFFSELLASHARPRLRKTVEAGCGWQARGPSLFVCGSKVAWQDGRREQCTRRGVRVCAMPPGLFNRALRNELLINWATTATIELREQGAVLLVIGGDDSVPEVTPATLADRLAQVVALTLTQTTVANVFLEGGATAAAVVTRLGLQQFRAARSPGYGVGALRPVGRDCPVFLIKPGSYPWPDTVWPAFS